ncbi:hypothetical protein D5S17_35430 [Pseudonocardiaceae bacterium YIM PH 21723]|nr:hypothetical protein D5S17_35430 [Pseudonocardiaceae bacterium YIM PH 21723]
MDVLDVAVGYLAISVIAFLVLIILLRKQMVRKERRDRGIELLGTVAAFWPAVLILLGVCAVSPYVRDAILRYLDDGTKPDWMT